MTLRDNRSMPGASVIPELAYPDVREAAQWLCRAFGFVERLRIGGHRVQLVYGNGAIVVVGAGDAPSTTHATHRVMVRVDDVDAHYAQAVRAGARIAGAPTDYPYGERQYGAIDPGGHAWTFSQSIADSDPASWGGELLP
ncbi:VOC family protein [Tahibacter soli]|jgi:uncharacterized glyoxalase superfamily protein PhnB|uniref:VOC family protein n=1 Tax=Tahibacter soli TaxID=2983605 RepID=A0A9X3YL01_9GAMM|nr:VOC family protein [Tahibacter soli]MDC8013549.1 VOC family protein [Tahibacter soli]